LELSGPLYLHTRSHWFCFSGSEWMSKSPGFPHY